MHEVSLVEALFDQTDAAIRPHPARSVREVTVRIGALSGVDGELFRTAFHGCKAERGYEVASLAIVDEPAQWHCPACEERLSPHGESLACPHCRRPAVLRAGGDLVLLRIDLEVPDV